VVQHLVEMDGDGVVVGGSGGDREVVGYVLLGDELDNGGAEKVTFVGGLDEVYHAERGYGVGEGAKKGE